MSFEEKIEFTKENIDTYLKEIAKEYRKQSGKTFQAELILIGGASVLVNYNFRNMTTDIDALIIASSAIKDAISKVGDRYDLPNGWLNDDFKNTASYSPKLAQISKYYKTFSNILAVRTVSAQHLIAMKLMSARQYKSDLSDIVGILLEHKNKGNPISLDAIKNATIDLYGNWNVLPEHSQKFISEVMDNSIDHLYDIICNGEAETKQLLVEFEKKYPNTIKEANIHDITASLQKKKSRVSVLEKLKEKKAELTNSGPSDIEKETEENKSR